MKILIDARMYGLEHAGIGRYVMNLVDQLQAIDKKNDYTLLVNKSKLKIVNSLEIGNALDPLGGKLEILKRDIPHYSIKEQIEVPKIISKINPDLVHFPHFNVPIFWRGKYVLTIHDLTKHSSRGMRTTTRNPLLYWAKYAGYKTVFSSAVRNAQKIIVPSEAVKDDLLKSYKILSNKVEVIYEGVDEAFTKQSAKGIERRVLKKYKINRPYLIYTGSAYPHKNLERLIEAVKLINSHKFVLNLVIVSSRNVFVERLRKFIDKTDSHKFVSFPGYVPDEELVVLYKNAKAFVFPSLAEGFGLPGVEAMVAGCPVICSDIPVFHEIYGSAAVYFDPTNSTDVADKIKLILADDKLRDSLVEKGKKRSSQFSWRKMAQETLRVYEEVTFFF